MKASAVLTAIEQATWKVRKDEDALLEAMKSVSSEIAQLNSEQADHYKTLAIIRLDDMARQPVVESMSALEQRARDGFLLFKKKADVFQTKRQELEELLNRKEEEQKTVMNRLEEAQRAVLAHEDNIQRQVENDATWLDFSKKIELINEKIAAAEAKAKSSERDRDEKNKPYHADKLFVYLRDRKYGVPDYKGNFLTCWGDHFVARTIRYEEARQNYFLLNELPKRLWKHAASVRKQQLSLIHDRNAYFRQRLEASGIIPLEKTVSDLSTEQKSIEKSIRDLKNALAQQATDYQRLLYGDHPEGLNAVIHELVSTLKQEDLRVLMRDALQTPTPKDEQVVEKLQVLENRINNLQAEVQKTRETLRRIAQRRVELERAQEDFHHARYNYRGGTFANDKIIGDILGGMIGGVLSSRELRDALRTGYREPPRRRQRDDDFWGGGSSWSGGGRMGGGGGFSTGGGFGGGGGGFRTGGGF